MLFFCLFQYFEEKEYQTESKRNETFGSVIFGTNVIQRNWSASQEAVEVATRVEGATPTRHAPYLVGPSRVHRCTSSSYIYPRTPKTSGATTKNYFHHCNLLYPRDPILEPLSCDTPKIWPCFIKLKFCQELKLWISELHFDFFKPFPSLL